LALGVLDRLPVLALNSGSSSLKFGLYGVGASATEVFLSGTVEPIDAGDRDQQARDALRHIEELLAERKLPAPAAIGHRVVHGGARLRRHCVIDEAVLRELEAATVFAPLHAPAALSVIRCARERFAGCSQAACLDTAFHAQLPEVARTLPIPRDLQALGIERYGFHGLSCESIVRQLGAALPQRLVIAHLGNGASITAVKGGRSIDTSMGLTPAGGVVMSTRCGDLDPGVLVYLLREKNLDAAQLDDLVNHRCGLLGISGIAGDLRRLREAARSNADARRAIEMFCYSVRKQVAAMTAALEGLDLLVFTGGIGEHDASARAAICRGLSWLPCPVRVLPAEEELQIARRTWELVKETRVA
jgi:acetate kinase